jgi:hypothetical protein
MELYLHSSNTPSLRGAQVKYRDNFAFTFTFIRFIFVMSSAIVVAYFMDYTLWLDSVQSELLKL